MRLFVSSRYGLYCGVDIAWATEDMENGSNGTSDSVPAPLVAICIGVSDLIFFYRTLCVI